MGVSTQSTWGTLIQLSLVKQPWQLNLWRLSSFLASLLPRQATAMELPSTPDMAPATLTEAPRVFPMAVMDMEAMERETLSPDMAMVDMVMVDTVLHPSLSPSPITAMVDHSLTAMDTTLDLDMERETLRPSQDTAMVPEATLTDHHKA